MQTCGTLEGCGDDDGSGSRSYSKCLDLERREHDSATAHVKSVTTPEKAQDKSFLLHVVALEV